MRTFFGLTDEYIENIYEQFFFLKYSGGWSFSEAYNLPVGLRKWFVERLIRQLETEKEAIELATRAIYTAIRRDSASGDGIVISVIDNKGYRKVDTKTVSMMLEK